MNLIRKYNIGNNSVTLFIFFCFVVSGCGHKTNQEKKDKTRLQVTTDAIDSIKKFKVTFIELGSVRCIPCRQMQAVMESVKAKYGNEVKIDFHDVWTEAGKPFGVKYGVEAIPTQIFLDETGREFYRHVGYFPEEELVKVLQQKGIKPI